ncbi:MAG: alpha/beta fold hydrolase [Stackebrandtia sp.]
MSVALHHELTGPRDAPVLVLSHALGLDSAMWTPLVPVLRRRFRLLLADTRGHGMSGCEPGPHRIEDLAADFLALFDRLGIARASWCGLSLGGMIGMWLAAHAPRRIDRLALCCTAPRLPPARAWRDRAHRVRQAGTTAGILDQSLDRWFSAEFRRRDPGFITQCSAALLSCGADGYAACCEAIADMDLRADLPLVTAPTMVVSGVADPVCPVATGTAISDSIPHSSFVVSPGRHLAIVESSEFGAPALLAHFIGPERQIA